MSGDDLHRPTVMVTVKLDGGEATPAEAARVLSLDLDDLDPKFGVVSVARDRDLYVVLVHEDAAERARAAGGAEGIFSNPRIEPVGDDLIDEF